MNSHAQELSFQNLPVSPDVILRVDEPEVAVFACGVIVMDKDFSPRELGIMYLVYIVRERRNGKFRRNRLITNNIESFLEENI